jgi:hypothetical protein
VKLWIFSVDREKVLDFQGFSLFTPVEKPVDTVEIPLWKKLWNLLKNLIM